MASNPTTLEQQMLTARSEYGFHAVAVGFNASCSVGRWWTANVHWKGFSRTGIACASGSADTPEAAIDAAIVEAAAQRAPYTDDTERDFQINRLREQLSALTGETVAETVQ